MTQPVVDCDYACDVDNFDDYLYEDEYEIYQKEEFVRWYYGKPQLDDFDDVDIDYTYGIDFDE
jgi:hypothetical protein